MKGPWGVFLGLAALWVAGILQIALAPRLGIGMGWPDFGLVVLSCLGLFCDRRGVTLLGFGAGLIQGSLVAST